MEFSIAHAKHVESDVSFVPKQLSIPKPLYRVMAIGVVEFSMEGYKIRKDFAKNQHTQRKFLNFENWTSREPQ